MMWCLWQREWLGGERWWWRRPSLVVPLVAAVAIVYVLRRDFWIHLDELVLFVGERLLWGLPLWVIWLVVHLIQLIGFRNKLLVLVNWAWNYFTYDRGVRLITKD